MRVLIIDDDVAFIRQLRLDIETQLYDDNENLIVDIICDKFNEFEYKEKYELVFLDIDLIYEDGFKIARKIRNNDTRVNIIFVSSKSNLVFHSFFASPFTFIRKEHYQRDLIYFFNHYKQVKSNLRVIDLIDSNTRRRKNIRMNTINYIECYYGELVIHTKEGLYHHRESIDSFLQQLHPSYIIRIHRSYAVNLEYVSHIDMRKVILLDQTELSIGRKYYKELIDTYQKYLIR